MAMNLKVVLEKAVINSRRSGECIFDAVSIVDGKEQLFPAVKFVLENTRDPETRNDLLKLFVVTAGSKTLLDFPAIWATAGAISSVAFAKTQYSNVADSPLFRMLYDFADRILSYSRDGHVVGLSTPSLPCMNCGFIFPARNITIDHVRPQTGGEIEAVAKTFRAFGLTKEGPKGPKGQAIQRHLASPMAREVLKPKAGRRISPFASAVSLSDRYTLNDNGAALYSLVKRDGNLTLLKTNCMHGLLNLQPLCQTCNSARSNPLKTALL